jgi:glycosyltransferase involved in cell wall biosynthesis
VNGNRDAYSFSVVMPNYNHGRWLVGSLTAILDQEPRPRQLIVVDDASTDHSREFLSAFAEATDYSLTTLFHQRNQGVIAASHSGLAVADTRYVYSLGPDDPVLPGFFRQSLDLLAQHPGAGLCFTDCRRLLPDGSRLEVRHHLSDRPRYFSAQQFAAAIRSQPRFSIATNTCTWRLDVLRGAWHDALADLHWHYDWFLSFVLAFRHGVCYVPQCLQEVRIDPDSYSLAGIRDQGRQRRVLGRLLEILAWDKFADVRQYFAVPSVLARFGEPILELLEQHPLHAGFLSDELVALARRAEGYNRERERQFAAGCAA